MQGKHQKKHQRGEIPNKKTPQKLDHPRTPNFEVINNRVAECHRGTKKGGFWLSEIRCGRRLQEFQNSAFAALAAWPAVWNKY